MTRGSVFVLNNINKRLTKLTGYTAFVVATFFLSPPILRGRPYGDDLLLLRASTTPGDYASQFFRSFIQVGGGKFRPLYTPVAYFQVHVLSPNYSSQRVFEVLLLTVVAYLAAVLAREMSNSSKIALVTAAFVVVSRFNWYSQTSFYGPMELLATGWALGAVICYVKWLRGSSAAYWLISSSLLFACATYTHERFLALTPAFVIAILCLARQVSRKIIGSLIFLSIPISHLIIKSMILHLDPLQGGGEVSIRSSAGPWLLHRWITAAVSIAGNATGSTEYFHADGYGLARAELILRKLGILAGAIFLAVVFIAIILCAKLNRQRRKREIAKEWVPTLFLTATVVLMLVPASTVISRIEGRWLFFPEIVGFVASTSIIKQSLGLKWVLVAVAPVFAFSMICRVDFSNFSYDAHNAQEIIEAVEKHAPRDGDWILQIDRPDTIPWQFGYGHAFDFLANKPLRVDFGIKPCERKCLRIGGLALGSLTWTYPD